MYSSLLIFSLPMSTKIDEYTMRLFFEGLRVRSCLKCGPMQINSLLPEPSLPQVKMCCLTRFLPLHARLVRAHISHTLCIHTYIHAGPLSVTINIINIAKHSFGAGSKRHVIKKKKKEKNHYNVYSHVAC